MKCARCDGERWERDGLLTHRNEGRVTVDGCERPTALRCLRCSFVVWMRCGSTREDRCESCGKRHGRYLKRIIMSGFSDRPSGFFFTTLTGLGSDRIPWDTTQCRIKGPHQCSGKLGCVAEPIAAALWNGCAPQAWSWFVTDLREALAGTDVQIWASWETQARGVLHRHAIVYAPGVTTDRYRAAVLDAAGRSFVMDGYQFSWGPQVDVQRIGAAANVPEIMMRLGLDEDDAAAVVDELETAEHLKSARYMAKYCTKGGDRARVLNRQTGELRECGRGYRPWSSTRRWGLTMRAVKASAAAYAVAAMAAAGAETESGAGAVVAPGGRLDTEADIYAGREGGDVLSALWDLLGASAV